jgi:hypothetical protein
VQGDGARELARFSKEAVGVLRTTENEHGGGSGVRSRFAAVGRVFGRFSALARRRASANEARGARRPPRFDRDGGGPRCAENLTGMYLTHLTPGPGRARNFDIPAPPPPYEYEYESE